MSEIESATPSYDVLKRVFGEVQTLEGVNDLLAWDARVGMPPGGALARGDQLGVLARVQHRMLTEPRVKDLLDAAGEEMEGADEWDRANLVIMRKRYGHATAVPGDLVGRIEKASSDCSARWRAARESGDFDAYVEAQTEVVELKREAAAALGTALNCEPYDALMDAFDPNMTAEKVQALFDPVADFLPEIIREVKDSQADQKLVKPRGPFPESQQMELGQRLMAALGVDPNHSRLDPSSSPFTVGVGAPYDVRITSTFSEENFLSPGMMGVVHEVGHQRYELGLPKDYYMQPVGQVPGMTAHESMSIFLERMIGRTPEFAAFVARQAREAFERKRSQAWSARNVLSSLREVKPGWKRTVADEVTYPAHILLRFEIEKMLFSGEMEVADISAYWNTRMKELLGVDVTSDAEGCLQDVHWPKGAFGYFPSYLLGQMSAAQFFQKMLQANPNILEGVERGDFGPIFEWLNVNIYSKGGLMSAGELVASVTGRTLDPAIFQAHLRERYLS